MRPREAMLEQLCGSRVRAGVLRALFEDTERRAWFREVARRARGGMSGTNMELVRLERIGLIRRKREGGACFFDLNREHPLYAPLCLLVASCDRGDREGWDRYSPLHELLSRGEPQTR